jgi:hypothetical protein
VGSYLTEGNEMDLLNLSPENDYWEFLAVLQQAHPNYTYINVEYENRRVYLLVKDRAGNCYLIDSYCSPSLKMDWVDGVIVSEAEVKEEPRKYYILYGEKVYL